MHDWPTTDVAPSESAFQHVHLLVFKEEKVNADAFCGRVARAYDVVLFFDVRYDDVGMEESGHNAFSDGAHGGGVPKEDAGVPKELS